MECRSEKEREEESSASEEEWGSTKGRARSLWLRVIQIEKSDRASVCVCQATEGNVEREEDRVVVEVQ